VSSGTEDTVIDRQNVTNLSGGEVGEWEGGNDDVVAGSGGIEILDFPNEEANAMGCRCQEGIALQFLTQMGSEPRVGLHQVQIVPRAHVLDNAAGDRSCPSSDFEYGKCLRGRAISEMPDELP
jgi:hypothetical protein